MAFTLGFWAVVWGAGVALLGGVVVVLANGWRWARLLACLLAVAAAAAAGMLLLFTGPLQMRITSPEGVWMYPLAAGLLVVSGFAGRRALAV